MLLYLFFAFQFLPILPQFFELRFLSSALGGRLLLCVLRHAELIFERALHVLGCLSLAADGVVFLLELGCFATQFLAGGLSAVVQ